MAQLSGFEDVEMPDPDEVPRRLGELGLDEGLLLEALRRGHLAGDFCTASHPRFYPGTVVYAETNAHVRAQLAIVGWSLYDDENIPRVVSPDGKVIITAVSGNQRTGLRSGYPAQTRRPRGQAGIRIVRRNAQLEFEGFSAADEAPDSTKGSEAGATWILLYYRIKDTIRSELSLANGVDESGTLLEWSERLILPEIDLNETPPLSRRGSESDQPEVEVRVERRAS